MKIELDEYDKILMIGLARLGVETVQSIKYRYAYMLDEMEQDVLSDQMLFYAGVVDNGLDGDDYKSEVERTPEQVEAAMIVLTEINNRIYQVQQAEDTTETLQ